MILEDVTSPLSPTWWPEEGDTGKGFQGLVGHGRALTAHTHNHRTSPQTSAGAGGLVPHFFHTNALVHAGARPSAGAAALVQVRGCAATNASPGTAVQGAPAPAAPWRDAAVPDGAGTASRALCLPVHEALTHKGEPDP